MRRKDLASVIPSWGEASLARRNPLSVGSGLASRGGIPTLFPFPRKIMSEDMKAHWAIEQWLNAARHLGVMGIICGKEAIPTILPIEEAHFMVSQTTYDGLEAVAERKSAIVERDTRLYNRFERG